MRSIHCVYLLYKFWNKIRRMQNRHTCSRGFSLIEFVLVIAALGLIAGLIVPLYIQKAASEKTLRVRVVESEGQVLLLNSMLNLRGRPKISIHQLPALPKNPKNGLSSVILPKQKGSRPSGWIFDPASGNLILNQ